jgi:hypothetical protein
MSHWVSTRDVFKLIIRHWHVRQQTTKRGI